MDSPGPYIPSWLRGQPNGRPPLEIDMRDFGAVGDAYQDDNGRWRGTYNDAAINTALTKANLLGGARVVGGGSGKYLANASIQIPSNVWFEGDGGTIVLSAESQGAHLVRMDDAHNVKFAGWILDGNNLNRPSGVGNNVHCVRIHNCIDYSIDQVDIYRSSAYSISNDVSCRYGLITRINIYNSRDDGIDVHNSDWQSGFLKLQYIKVDGFGSAGAPKAGIHMRGEGIDLSHFEVLNCLDTTLGNIYGVLYGNGETVRGGRISNGRIDLGVACFQSKGLGFHNPFGVIDKVVVAGDSAINPVTGLRTLGTNTAFVLQSPNIRLTNSLCVGKQVFDTSGNLLSTGKTISHGLNIAAGADNCVIDGTTMSDVGGSAYFDQANGTIYGVNKGINADLWGFDLSGATGTRRSSFNASTNCLSGDVNPGTDTLTNQTVAPTSSPTLKQLTITDAPTNPQHTVTKATLDAALTGRSVLYQSGEAVVLSGTSTETALATVTVPGGLMGLNGRLEIIQEQSHTSSANAKTIRVRFGGIGGTVFLSMAVTTNATSRFFTDITNRNDVAKQVGWASNNGTFGQSGTAVATATKNTAVDQDLVITGQLTSTGVTAGESITLEGVSIRFIPGA